MGVGELKIFLKPEPRVGLEPEFFGAISTLAPPTIPLYHPGGPQSCSILDLPHKDPEEEKVSGAMVLSRWGGEQDPGVLEGWVSSFGVSPPL